MTLSNIWEWLVWLLLAGGSVLTLGIACETFFVRLRQRARARRHSRELSAARNLLLAPAASGEIERKKSDRARAELAQLDLPLAQFLVWLIDYRGGTDWKAAAEWRAAVLVDALDGGRVATLQAISRLAPLAALGGTVVGVARSLSAFADNPAAHTAVFSGLSLALFTTAVGVVVAIFSYSVGAVLEAYLSRMELELRNLLLEATCSRTPLAASLAATV